MPLPRYYKLDPEARERLLSAARAEMVEHGYENASFNRVIERAGISKGAMYYYFADKADLYRTVVEGVLDDAVESIGDVAPAKNAAQFWQALDDFMQRALAWITTEPQLAELGKAVYSNVGGVLDALRTRLLLGVEEVIAQGQTAGAVRTDLPRGLLAEAATGMLLGADRWFAEHFREFEPGEIERLSLASYALLRQLLELTPSPKPKNRGRS